MCIAPADVCTATPITPAIPMIPTRTPTTQACCATSTTPTTVIRIATSTRDRPTKSKPKRSPPRDPIPNRASRMEDDRFTASLGPPSSKAGTKITSSASWSPIGGLPQGLQPVSVKAEDHM